MEDTREIFTITQDLQNCFRSHDHLCQLANKLQYTTFSKITIDLTGVNFIAANLFSVLGCIFYEYAHQKANDDAIMITGVNRRISDVMRKNGFCQHIGLKRKKDVHNTIIPYMIFPVNKIDEYERYLTINLFTRKDLPSMSQAVTDAIRDSLLELFKNVSDHTTSEHVFTCGQYFPKSYMLYFTLVDIGETISYNVNRFHRDRHLPLPSNPLNWALKMGNSTIFSSQPRGIGFTLIRDFVSLNNGDFYVLSDSITYEFHRGQERYKQLSAPFPGTIVTIGFNLHDNSTYRLKSDVHDTIQF